MSYDPSTAAILLVDPYDNFLSEGGKIWPRVKAVANETVVRFGARWQDTIFVSRSRRRAETFLEKGFNFYDHFASKEAHGADLERAKLEAMTETIPLDQVFDAVARIMKGETRGGSWRRSRESRAGSLYVSYALFGKYSQSLRSRMALRRSSDVQAGFLLLAREVEPHSRARIVVSFG